VCVQNLCKYGVLVRPSSLLYLAKIPNVVLTMSIWIYIFVAYGIEILHGRVPCRLHLALHWVNALASFLGPWYGMWYLQTDPGGGTRLKPLPPRVLPRFTVPALRCPQAAPCCVLQHRNCVLFVPRYLVFLADGCRLQASSRCCLAWGLGFRAGREEAT